MKLRLCSLIALLLVLLPSLDSVKAQGPIGSHFVYTLLNQEVDPDKRDAHLILSNFDGSEQRVLESIEWTGNNGFSNDHVRIADAFISILSPDGNTLFAMVSNAAMVSNQWDPAEFPFRFYSMDGELVGEFSTEKYPLDIAWAPDSQSILYKMLGHYSQGQRRGDSVHEYNFRTGVDRVLISESPYDTDNRMMSISPDGSSLFLLHIEWGKDLYPIIIPTDQIDSVNYLDIYNHGVNDHIEVLCDGCVTGNIVLWSNDSQTIYFGGGMPLTSVNIQTHETRTYACRTSEKLHFSDGFVCWHRGEAFILNDGNKSTLNLNVVDQDVQVWLGRYGVVSPDDSAFLLTGMFDEIPRLFVLTIDGQSHWEIPFPDFGDETALAVTNFDW